jgi:hypothetical protein
MPRIPFTVAGRKNAIEAATMSMPSTRITHLSQSGKGRDKAFMS